MKYLGISIVFLAWAPGADAAAVSRQERCAPETLPRDLAEARSCTAADGAGGVEAGLALALLCCASITGSQASRRKALKVLVS